MKTILLLALTGMCLASNRIAGYEPHTVVIDYNNIDLDQRDIETQLSLGSAEGYDAAMEVYTKGAHCSSYSTLMVQPLQASLNFGDQVSGLAQDGSMITATVMQNYPKGREDIDVSYTVNANTTSFCQIGGNPDPITDGCKSRWYLVWFLMYATQIKNSHSFSLLVSNFRLCRCWNSHYRR
jgi:hypothetical protein